MKSPPFLQGQGGVDHEWAFALGSLPGRNETAFTTP